MLDGLCFVLIAAQQNARGPLTLAPSGFCGAPPGGTYSTANRCANHSPN